MKYEENEEILKMKERLEDLGDKFRRVLESMEMMANVVDKHTDLIERQQKYNDEVIKVMKLHKENMDNIKEDMKNVKGNKNKYEHKEKYREMYG